MPTKRANRSVGAECSGRLGNHVGYPIDHVHLAMSVPPKYSVSTLMEYLKGKLSLRLFQRYDKLGKRYWGRHLGARGYCVSTVGLKEKLIRRYVKFQETKGKELEQSQITLYQ